MKVLSYIIRIFLLPIGPFRKLNKSIQLYSCKRWYIEFAGPRVPEEIQTPVFFKSSRFYFLTSKCWWVEIFNGKSSAGNHEQRSTSFKETYLSQSTPKHASTEFIVNSNLLLPHIHIVCLSKAQKPGILDPNLVTVSYSTGAHYKLQAAVASSRISQPAVLDPPPSPWPTGQLSQCLLPPQLWEHNYFWGCSTSWATELLSIKKLVMVSMDAQIKWNTRTFGHLDFKWKIMENRHT